METDWRQLNGVADRCKAFDQKHSEYGEPILSNGWVLFADGSKRDSDPAGLYCEPVDPLERQRGVVQYCKAIHTMRQGFFQSRKREITESLRAVARHRGVMNVAPDLQAERWEEELLKLQSAAEQARKNLELAMAELERVSPTDKARQDMTDTVKAQAATALSRLNAIGL